MIDRKSDPYAATGDPRHFLLMAVRTFVRAICGLAGLHRIALMGSLTTDKPTPKDADVLVTNQPRQDLTDLARPARPLNGAPPTTNLGRDIFHAFTPQNNMGRGCPKSQFQHPPSVPAPMCGH